MNDELKSAGLFSGQDAVAAARQKREAPGPHFERVAKMWSALLGHYVAAEQVVQCMIALKLAREAGQHDPDNMIDAEGYASLMPEVVKYTSNSRSVGPSPEPTCFAGPIVEQMLDPDCDRPGMGRSQSKMTPAPFSRSRAVELARMHAIKGGATGRHSYLPTNVVDGMSWEPHDWVVEAILQAANAQ